MWQNYKKTHNKINEDEKNNDEFKIDDKKTNEKSMWQKTELMDNWFFPS